MAYRDKNKQRAFQVDWRNARRNAFIVSKGGVCAKCGSSDRLEVDHIDRSLKTMSPTRLWSRSEEIRSKELENCQVLCSICHKEKTAVERYVENPCGIYAKYKSGCRCDLCKAANAAKARGYRGNSK